MSILGPPSLPECIPLDEEFGLRLYALKKTLLFSYEPKIKLIAIGKENGLEIKSIMLLGATGAGKTCLINALVNHLLNVHFEDNYRYILKDETGENPKSMAESQTDYVVGYLIYSPEGSGHQYNYLLIDTPGFKDSRGDEKDHEVIDQIKTFLQDVDGVDELNCIGFVVNGTIARIQPQFSEIVETFCNIFGENAKEIIRTLISFGHMRQPPVLDVLEASCLKDYKRFMFDNYALKEYNHPTRELTEEDINVHKSFWTRTARVYDSMINEISNSNAVSLSMTRETLEHLQALNKSANNMKISVDAYLDDTLMLKQFENECSDIRIIKEANVDFNGTVDVKVRRVDKHLKKTSRWVKHSHNCEKCMITCHYPCDHTRKHCPKNGELCKVCHCPNSSHDKSRDIISHYIEKRSVIHEDKKALYEDALAKENNLLENIAKVTEEIDCKRGTVEERFKEVLQKSEIVKSNSLGSSHCSPLQYVYNVVETVRIERFECPEVQPHVIPILEDLSRHLELLGLE